MNTSKITSFPPPSNRLHRMTREQLIEYCEGLETQNERLAQELKWVKDVIANPELKGNEPRFLIAMYEETVVNPRRSPADPEGRVRVYREDLAKRAGISVQTVSKIGKELGDSGIINRKTTPAYDKKNNKPGTDLFVALPSQTLINPSGISHAEASNWGGKRFCKACGSDNLIVKKTVVCADCGVIHEQKESKVNAPELQDEYTHPVYDTAPDEDLYKEISIDIPPEEDLVPCPVDPKKKPPYVPCEQCGEMAWNCISGNFVCMTCFPQYAPRVIVPKDFNK